MAISLIPSATIKIVRPPERKARHIVVSGLEPYDWVDCINPSSRRRWNTSVERVVKFKNQENVYRLVTESGRVIELPYNAHLLGLLEGEDALLGPHCVVDFLFDASANARSEFGKESSRRRHALVFDNIPASQGEGMRKILKIPRGKYPAGATAETMKFVKVFYSIEEAVECYSRVLEKLPDWNILLGGSTWMSDGRPSFKRIFSVARLNYSFKKYKTASVVVHDGGTLRLETIREIEWFKYDNSVLELQVAYFNNVIIDGFVIFDVPKIWSEEA